MFSPWLELQDAVTSKRLHGCTIADIPGGVTQASPLTVDELCRLHTILHERCDWTAVFVGAVAFCDLLWSTVGRCNAQLLIPE